MELDRGTVLGKAMVVLHAFGPDEGAVTFSTLQERTRLPKATLHRVLGALVSAGLLDRTAAHYRLGRALFQLGMRASSERGLLEVATPFMEDLYERTHETVHLGVREGNEVVYVAKMGGHRQARTPSRLGGRMPLAATAIGKALLAHAPDEVRREALGGPIERRTPRTITAPGVLAKQLARIVESGVAFDYEESAVGIVCVAAAVFDADDRAVAAVSLTGPVTRFHPASHASAVHGAAAGIAATLARGSAQRNHRLPGFGGAGPTIAP